MKILIGQDARDFEGMKSALSLAEKKLATAEKNVANARAGWITASAELSDVQEAFDQLNAELLDTRVQLAKAKQEADMFKRALATVSDRFLAHVPEYGEALS